MLLLDSAPFFSQNHGKNQHVACYLATLPLEAKCWKGPHSCSPGANGRERAKLELFPPQVSISTSLVFGSSHSGKLQVTIFLAGNMGAYIEWVNVGISYCLKLWFFRVTSYVRILQGISTVFEKSLALNPSELATWTRMETNFSKKTLDPRHGRRISDLTNQYKYMYKWDML